MLTVAEGGVLGACVIDAHPAMRRNVIPTKVELMKLIFCVASFMGVNLVLLLTSNSVDKRNFAASAASCL